MIRVPTTRRGCAASSGSSPSASCSALLVFLVGADTLGRLFIDKSFHVGDVVYGSLIGALLLLLGVETAARFPGGKR
jgi:hypothetical protein